MKKIYFLCTGNSCRGRKVVHLEIYNRFYPRKPKSHDETIEPVPMIDWTEDKKNILL